MVKIEFTKKYFQKESIRLFEGFHSKIFGHAMSDTMREFLGHLSWSFFGGVTAAGIMFAVNIFAGRMLGPEGYGKYNYLLSLATVSMLVFLLGSDSSGVRYISDKRYVAGKNGIFTAAFVLALFQAAIFLFAIILFHGFIAEHFGIDERVVYLVFIFGFVLSFKSLFDSFLRAFGLIRKQSLFKILDAIVVAVVFLAVFYFLRGKLSYLEYVYSFMVGGFSFLLFSLYALRGNFSKFTPKQMLLLLHYNKFLILASVGGVIIGLDKVFIGKFIGTEVLGVYSAYYASSQLIVSNLTIIFMSIFWPMVIRNKENLSVILDKIYIIIFKFFPVFLVLNFVSVSFFVYLFGREYPFDLLLVMLFSAASILNVLFFVFISILNIDGIKQSVAISVICYSTIVSSIVIFRSIEAYLISQIVIYAIGILYIRSKLRQIIV